MISVNLEVLTCFPLAGIEIYAYGNKVVDEVVNLCQNNITELCPVTQGDFFASGNHNVPSNYTESISQAAYLVPDLEGSATIQIFNASNSSQILGCFISDISNGKSTKLDGVKYATIGLAAAALVISAVSSATNGSTSTGSVPGGHPIPSNGVGGTGAAVSGTGTNVAAGGWHPPGFVEFFSVLQGIAISGMYSLNYPSAYRNFSQNVGWSTGMITWGGMQKSIDNFRKRTGGNLTGSSYERLQQTILVYLNDQNKNLTSIDTPIGSNSTSKISLLSVKFKKTVDRLLVRDSNDTSEVVGDDKKYVSIVTGIKAYVEKLTIPDTNTFMTLLIWWAIIIGACIAVILAVKLALEIWSIKGNPKQKFRNFRKRYWMFLGSTLIRLILIFYGLWVLYCFYQFKIGDSWGTRLLAGILFGTLTIILVGFTLRIVLLARQASKERGGLDYLFKHTPWIRKYGLFYDQFKVRYWWCFIPVLMASFGRNAFIALGYGNGMVQVIGQLVIDILLALLFIITMPFNTKMGNSINLAIQIVRVISLALLLTFAFQFNLKGITATGIGLALIVIQAALTILLAFLILMNACVGISKMVCGKRRKKTNQIIEPENVKDRRESGEVLEYDEENRIGLIKSSNSKIDKETEGIISLSTSTSNEKGEARLTESSEVYNGQSCESPQIKHSAVKPRSVQSSMAAAHNIPLGSTAKASFDHLNRNSLRLSILSGGAISANSVNSKEEGYHSAHETIVQGNADSGSIIDTQDLTHLGTVTPSQPSPISPISATSVSRTVNSSGSDDNTGPINFSRPSVSTYWRRQKSLKR